MTLETWQAVLGLLAVFVGLVTAVVSLTLYFARIQGKQERLEAERKTAEVSFNAALRDQRNTSEQQLSNFAATIQHLKSEIVDLRTRGAAVLHWKAEIDNELVSIMQKFQAESGSIYVPMLAGPARDTTGLVFLSIQPVSNETMALRRKVIPLASIAGRCLTTGKSFVSTSSKADDSHYEQADAVSGYQTEDTLNLVLRASGRTVGVLQLLNRKGDSTFTDLDLSLAETYAPNVAAKVALILESPENLELLGLSPEKEREIATILFCDITRSSILFQEMHPSAAIQHLNEYLERVGEIALKHGATIDKYMGDGVMFRFNVPKPVDNHEIRAVKAALEMLRSFEKLRADWVVMGEKVRGLRIRIGLGQGAVYQAIIGHPQFQTLTVMGTAVNVAVNLCDVAARDHDVIVADESIYKALGSRLVGTRLATDGLGKAMAYTSAAYEVLDLLDEQPELGMI